MNLFKLISSIFTKTKVIQTYHLVNSDTGESTEVSKKDYDRIVKDLKKKKKLR